MLVFEDARAARRGAPEVVAAAERVLSRRISSQAGNSHAENATVASVRGFGLFLGTRSVLRDVSFDVRRGEVAALAGPAGCGSKTMLAALGGALPSANRLRIEGEISRARAAVGSATDTGAAAGSATCTGAAADPARTAARDADSATLADVSDRNHSATAYFAGRPEAQSARNALARPLRLRGVRDEGAIDQAIDRALFLMDMRGRLSGAMDAPVCSLPKAERNLIAIAQAYLCFPDLLLAEEPTRGLSVPDARVIARALQNLACKANLAVVVETSDVQAACRIASRVHFFLQGRLVESFPAAGSGREGDVRPTPADYRTRAFLEGRMR